ncbi:MAG: ferritin family protein [Gammaproteobacteria bacterium]|nr:ferritin family protein [Gammaproteobacteria bacterium]
MREEDASHRTTNPRIGSVADLVAIAHRIETDAVERYQLLADQMETHNNVELTRMFLDLARAERLHAEEIHRLAKDRGIVESLDPIGPWRGDGPEAIDLGEAHYRMTPYDALRLALAGEQRALAFYGELAAAHPDPAVRKLAGALADEEQEHVDLCHRLLHRYPAVETDRDADPDRPPAGD